MQALNVRVVSDDIDFANRGEGTLLRFQERHFDVTFMDIQLPVMKGLELHLQLKQRLIEVPTTMMSDYVLEHGVKKTPFKRQSRRGCLEKSFGPNLLSQTLHDMLPDDSMHPL